MKKYELYDGEATSIFDKFPTEEAETAKEAILKYLAKTGRHYKLKRSAEDDVMFSAMPFEEIDGKKVRIGRQVWYKIISQ